jgi:predicted permease
MDDDFQQELDVHLDLLTEENIRRGMPCAEARREAALRLGARETHKELHREVRGLPAADVLLQDLRYSFRTLRRDPGFTAFAVLIVALGIGAGTTIFSVINALVLRPLPFEDPGKLIWMANTGTDGLSGTTVPVNYYLDLRRAQSFSDVAAYYPFYRTGDSKLIGGGKADRLTSVPVSWNFFHVLGVKPEIGRLFQSSDSNFPWFRPPSVLLSHGFWQRRFQSNPDVVGATVNINDSPVLITGVLPASFDFSSVFAPGTRIDLYLPFPLTGEANRRGNTMAMIGRLKPAATIDSADAEMRVLVPQIRLRDPQRHFEVALTPLNQRVTGRLRPALLVLACAVGAVMLIVCANLANLLIARSTARQKEFAVRAALGAGRRRLVHQLLTESLVLTGCGAVLGAVFAFLGSRVISRLDGLDIPLLAAVHTDPRALAFTLLLAILTGLLLGIAPALRLPLDVVRAPLQSGVRGVSAGREHGWIRAALVVSEVALASVLLVGAGLLTRSFLRVLDVDLGFQPARAAALRVDPDSRFANFASRNAYYTDLLTRVKAVPGIEAAGLSDFLPLGSNRSWSAGAKGRPYSRQNPPPDAFPRIVSEGYWTAMGIPLISGRVFTEADTVTSKPVIVINQTLARTLWPNEDPIGQTLLFTDRDREVIGVVADVRHLALEEGSGCEMYIPIRQTGDYSSVDLVVRTSLTPAALAAGVRAALKPVDPNLPSNEFRTLQQLVDRAVSPRRFVVLLLAGFSGFALLLAALGIYAVIAYSASRRTQEIGIRMALGASAGELQARILLQTLRLTAAGLFIGVVGAWILARAISGLLFGITPTDPITYAAMFSTLGVASALAGYIPARRACRIDPMQSLRAE